MIKRIWVSCVGAVTVALLALPIGAMAAAPQPYGTNDAGGFLNVLPPGEAGVDNIVQFTNFTATGAFPNHWIDQQPLYENLVYASPKLTNAQVPDYFKDATFGVPAGQIESTISPRPGVTIIRDSAYGVPHIYGDTRGDTIFGAGYAGAADRLFLMDILRHTGRADLSTFVGGSNISMDEDQWRAAPYTEVDLQRQIDDAPKVYGAEGAQAVADLNEYVAGINAYITQANLNPTLKPAEYTLLGKPTIEPWKATDVIATASLIGGIFGKGGGRELDSALTMQKIVDRFGGRAGRRAWAGFRSKNDPEAPTTVSRRFPYETEGAFSRRGLALPDRGSVTDVPISANPAVRSQAGASGIGASLRKALAGPGHASNWELVSARESRTGHPIGVLGPQVGYYNPQILMEEDLHGPGIDAEGAAFPGANLFVLLGHGRDYAWSATTATADNVDTFAEVLCRDAVHYVYRGKCLPMEPLSKTNTWIPNALDQTPPGSETMTVYRTVHGIVYARGKVRGRNVAFARSRSTYFHEADSVLGFSRLNDPSFTTGVKRFKAAVSKINFLFNWSYLDSKDIGYFMSGSMPQRAGGTSPDFPVLGTGRFDWKGFNPKTFLADFLPNAKHPQAVNPPYLVSWNNKQAPGWAAADDQYAYSSVHRSQMISDRVRRGTRGRRKMTIAQLVRAMEEPATTDLRGYRVLPVLLRAIGRPPRGLVPTVRTLRAWTQTGAHRRDLNRDGTYDDNAAVTLMDAWWPRLVTAEFQPRLGSGAFNALSGMTFGLGDHTGGAPHAPAFFDGWWGYVSKDLRALYGRHRPRGAFSRIYCGKGSRRACRRSLLATLKAATKVTPAQLYGFGKCAANPQASCFDQNRPIEATGIPTGAFPFQNRPTFQQVVTLTKRLPR